MKQKLRIYRCSELKNLDEDDLQQRDVVEIETGVEKHEEKEVHLHRILKRGGQQLKADSKDYIPTPDASATWPLYDQFYQGEFHEPQTYIKSSATVEECCGIDYTMDEVDEEFLQEMNNYAGKQLTEDEFELLCSAFERAIKERQPFLSVDPLSILSFDEIKITLLKLDYNDFSLKKDIAEKIGYSNPTQFHTIFDHPNIIQSNLRPLEILIEKHGSEVYDHWKSRKMNSVEADIFPKLKFERPGEKEEVDPYVCFRRREVRQPRKTRKVDILNSQKLRILNKELKRAKELALLVAQREFVNLSTIEDELNIHSMRCKMMTLKRSADIKDESFESLIMSTVIKKRKTNVITVYKRQQMLEQQRLDKMAENALASESAKKGNSVGSSSTSKRLNKRVLEQMIKSGQKLTKPQIALAQKLSLLPSDITPQQLIQQQEQASQQQGIKTGQQQPNPTSHVYVKLPTSKIPDILLEEVDTLLASKERNAKKFVLDRMEKRKAEDGDIFFNLTDNPYNPVFDVSLPKSGLFYAQDLKVLKSHYLPGLDEYLMGTAKDVQVYNSEGERLDVSNSQTYKKTEIFDPYKTPTAENPLTLTKEHPFKFRRRMGRCNIEYLDMKPNGSVSNSLEDIFGEFFDLEAVDNEQKASDKVFNVYDSQWDTLSRMYSRWKYDSPRNEYGTEFYKEPCRLNQVSPETQAIRFGAMLGSKSYEQLREVVNKYRKEYLTKIRLQQSQQAQALAQAEQVASQPQVNMTQVPALKKSTEVSTPLSPSISALNSNTNSPSISNKSEKLPRSTTPIKRKQTS